MPEIVAVVAQEPLAFFELGVVVEVFGIDRTAEGVPAFDFRLCSPAGEPAPTALRGVSLSGLRPLDDAADADLVVVPSSPLDQAPSPAVIEVLKAANGRGSRVLAMCSGAFALAWAGLLDGRRAATHWRYAAGLRAQFPRVLVDEDVLYVDEGNIVTSAGTAAGIDACLHLVRADHGSAVAATIARRMVVAPHREGGQRQFIEQPVPEHGTSLEPVLQSVLDALDSPHTVASLARRASMSTRTFARHFRAQTGTSPSAWITAQRVLAARRLLETEDIGMEHVAARVGFGTAMLLRHHFQRQLGITPTAYRRAFRRAHG